MMITMQTGGLTHMLSTLHSDKKPGRNRGQEILLDQLCIPREIVNLKRCDVSIGEVC